MTGRMSLAEQLASIRNDAPVEFDPESVDYGASTSAGRDLDAGRADYLDVGTSQLRKNLDTEAGPRYVGTKSSRKELYGEAEPFGPVDGSEDSEDLSSEEDDEEDVDENVEEDGLDFEDESENQEASEVDEETGSEEDDSEGSSRSGKQPSRDSRTNGAWTGDNNAHLDKESRAMIQELKKASSADVEKGRDVRKQLSFWDTLLEARIRLQKCVTSAHALPEPGQAAAYSELSPDEISKTKASLEALSELLFDIRSNLYSKNDKVDVSAATSKKRKRASSEYIDNAMDVLYSMGETIVPYEHSTISKWSDKVSSASSALGNQNKFKALGPQNTLRQIESILSQDMDRLVERSRIRRGPSGKIVKVVGRDGAHEPVAGEKDVSAEVFDDTDFYQALLRDVVDIGHGSVSAGGPASYANFNNVSRKKAAGVDPKASKGRKLRYHVHEKLQNFMAPIPTISWEKEQIDELFKGLLGGRNDFGSAISQEESTDQNGTGADLGQFRIF